MALGAVLKDRARYVRNEPAAVKVEGSTVMVSDSSPWFRARLEMTALPESQDSQGRSRIVPAPSLMFGVRDSEGNSLIRDDGGCVISAQDRIEVESRELGTAIWEVTGDPVPMRKKRTVLGYQAPLQRVDTRTFA